MTNSCISCGLHFEGHVWQTHCPPCYDKHLRPPKLCKICGQSFKSKYKICHPCHTEKVNAQEIEQAARNECARREMELEPARLLERIEILETQVAQLQMHIANLQGDILK